MVSFIALIGIGLLAILLIPRLSSVFKIQSAFGELPPKTGLIDIPGLTRIPRTDFSAEEIAGR